MHAGLRAQCRDPQKTQVQLELLLNLFSVSLFSCMFAGKKAVIHYRSKKGDATKRQLNLYIILMTYKLSKRKLSRMFQVTHNHLFHFQHANLLPTKYCKIIKIHQQSTENEDPNSKSSSRRAFLHAVWWVFSKVLA